MCNFCFQSYSTRAIWFDCKIVSIYAFVCVCVCNDLRHGHPSSCHCDTKEWKSNFVWSLKPTRKKERDSVALHDSSLLLPLETQSNAKHKTNPTFERSLCAICSNVELILLSETYRNPYTHRTHWCVTRSPMIKSSTRQKGNKMLRPIRLSSTIFALRSSSLSIQ